MVSPDDKPRRDNRADHPGKAKFEPRPRADAAALRDPNRRIDRKRDKPHHGGKAKHDGAGFAGRPFGKKPKKDKKHKKRG